MESKQFTYDKDKMKVKKVRPLSPNQRRALMRDVDTEWDMVQNGPSTKDLSTDKKAAYDKFDAIVSDFYPTEEDKTYTEAEAEIAAENERLGIVPPSEDIDPFIAETGAEDHALDHDPEHPKPGVKPRYPSAE